MKRFLLCFALIVCLLLCACGQNTQPESSDASESAAPVTEAEPSTKKPAETEAPAETEKPAETTAATEAPTEAAPVLEENSAFLPYETDGGSPLGVIVNAPFTQEPSATEIWIEGDIDAAYIIPRYAGSTVTLYRINWEEDGSSSNSVEHTAVAEDGCAIYGALFRPEGMPMWYVEITAPDGSTDGLELSYNGDTGTPPLEYIG